MYATRHNRRRRPTTRHPPSHHPPSSTHRPSHPTPPVDNILVGISTLPPNNRLITAFRSTSAGQQTSSSLQHPTIPPANRTPHSNPRTTNLSPKSPITNSRQAPITHRHASPPTPVRNPTCTHAATPTSHPPTPVRNPTCTHTDTPSQSLIRHTLHSNRPQTPQPRPYSPRPASNTHSRPSEPTALPANHQTTPPTWQQPGRQQPTPTAGTSIDRPLSPQQILSLSPTPICRQMKDNNLSVHTELTHSPFPLCNVRLLIDCFVCGRLLAILPKPLLVHQIQVVAVFRK